MDVRAWCGHCGESFALRETVEDGQAMRCPRCDEALAPDYTSVASAAVHDVLSAAEALESSLNRLQDVADGLHVDRRRLAADLGPE